MTEPVLLAFFYSKDWLEDWTFRLASDHTLNAPRCWFRQRFDGPNIDGSLLLIHDYCSANMIATALNL